VRIAQVLAARLKQVRIKKGDRQEIFAQRLSVSRSTYIRMEKGDPRIAKGHWVDDASYLLRELDNWQEILKPQMNLFDLYELSQQPQRQRVSRKINI